MARPFLLVYQIKMSQRFFDAGIVNVRSDIIGYRLDFFFAVAHRNTDTRMTLII